MKETFNVGEHWRPREGKPIKVIARRLDANREVGWEFSDGIIRDKEGKAVSMVDGVFVPVANSLQTEPVHLRTLAWEPSDSPAKEYAGQFEFKGGETWCTKSGNMVYISHSSTDSEDTKAWLFSDNLWRIASGACVEKVEGRFVRKTCKKGEMSEDLSHRMEPKMAAAPTEALGEGMAATSQAQRAAPGRQTWKETESAKPFVQSLSVNNKYKSFTLLQLMQMQIGLMEDLQRVNAEIGRKLQEGMSRSAQDILAVCTSATSPVLA